ncbi:NAD(P)-dependent oxidoreductase [Kaustia mangrovi]|uniref:NAD(P)-dependent oxidoreductase n=1 Tax=Kaustia mangrovi TaxID=2593653 RepID=A0A7S8HD88_9HYPH|nr:NAD(P)-dependent oxidoreductase [Kaustia mangrovi]QPC44547.1 NAD(P)-dependent oxidoreductase [Kaustia mangrovi]
MSSHPILLVGGSGVVGRHAARFLREAHPDLPLLIAGRDLAKAKTAAAEIGGADSVTLDLAADDLGLGARPVGAVAVLFMDDRMAGLHFAQSRGVPYMSISPLLQEIGPEVGGYIHRPGAAPVILGTEWLVGATTVPTLEFARAYGRLDSISIGALLDDEDTGGPAQTADLERVTKTAPAALARRGGRFVWRVGDDAVATIRAVDGTAMDATALSPNDVVGLAMATGAPNVEFNLATGVSSTRRRGGPMSTEIVIDLAGEDHAGRPLRTRHAVVHPDGQFPLTGLGVAMGLESAAGLAGGPAVPAGLYFPYRLLEPEAYLARLERIGGRVLTLETP